MFHIDPRLVGIFVILFFAMGAYNIYMGRRRTRVLRAHGRREAWYKQVGYLTGIEYSLLAIVLILNEGIASGFFPESLAIVVVPVYIIALVLAAIVLFIILYQGVVARRNARTAQNRAHITNRSTEKPQVTPEQRSTQVQRRRGRRQKAAAARRRQTGRA